MGAVQLPNAITPAPAFRQQVENLCGEKVSACYQCEKCTSGCPVAYAMDIVPHKMIRAVHLGLKDTVLKSDTIWVCASCETCTTRCPNGIDIAKVMDALRQIQQEENVPASKKSVTAFHTAFLNSVQRHGRIFEAAMAVEFSLRAGGIQGLLKQRELATDMLKHNKIRFVPSSLTANAEVKDIFKRTGRNTR